MLGIVIIILIVIIWYFWYYKYSRFNTRPIIGTREAYYVHNQHHDPKKAAQLLENITDRNSKLIKHLKSKYTSSHKAGVNPSKRNRIDIISGSAMYPLREVLADNLYNVELREYLQERITQLLKNYNTDRIYEISPLNKSGATSYSENKRTLVLCLRHKKPNNFGQYTLHDINTMMFVVIHEIAHMMNNKWGHGQETNFWPLCKFLLANATEIGIYTPVDYSKHPVMYCGMRLAYNPIYDAGIENLHV